MTEPMATTNPAGRTGQPWSSSEDAYLLVSTRHEPIRELARVLRRDRREVKARIAHLDLTGDVQRHQADIAAQRANIARANDEARSYVDPDAPRRIARIGVIRAWTPDEDEQVLARGCTDRELAARIGRTEAAVSLRRSNLRKRQSKEAS